MTTSYTLLGFKWGSSTIGTAGGQVTWSFAQTAGTFFQFDAPIADVSFAGLIRAAFDAWEAVANIDFVEVADTAASNVRLGWDWIDGAGGSLGEAHTSWLVGGFNTAVHAEIRFDSGDPFAADSSGFYALALHEIGHAIGLGHTDDPGTVMYPYLGQTLDLSPGEVAGAQTLYGPAVPVPSAPVHYSSNDIAVVAATYQFYTGIVPGKQGFDYLISSPANPADLNDPYYAAFNQENRFINFSNNLGAFGEGADMFDAAYAGLSFKAAVTKAYDEIVGIAEAQAAGIDVNAALAFLHGALGFYTQVALDRVVAPGVSLADATKLVMIGSVLHESVKAGVGHYADAVDHFASDYQSGGPVPYGSDIIAVYV